MSRARVFSDREMLCALNRCAGLEPTLSRNDYDRRKHDDDPSMQLFERRFGTWNAALERAGLQTTEQPRNFRDRTTKWSEDQILDAIRECRQKTGSTALDVYEAWRTGRTTGVAQAHVPPATTVRFRMGSWSAATELARRP